MDHHLNNWKLLGSKAANALNNLNVNPFISLKSISNQISQLTKGYIYGTEEVGFPANSCIGRSEVICHGLPDDRLIRSQDLIKVDLVLKKNGLYVDTCWTFLIGLKNRNFWMRSYLSFCIMLKVLIFKKNFNDLQKISKRLLKTFNLNVVKEFVGHGIGFKMHQEPEVDIFDSTGPVNLNSALTLEPIFSENKRYKISIFKEHEYLDKKGNFIMFEHTVLFLNEGTYILTLNKFDEKFKFLQYFYKKKD